MSIVMFKFGKVFCCGCCFVLLRAVPKEFCSFIPKIEVDLGNGSTGKSLACRSPQSCIEEMGCVPRGEEETSAMAGAV